MSKQAICNRAHECQELLIAITSTKHIWLSGRTSGLYLGSDNSSVSELTDCT
jgi:hypothetical protein